MKTNDITYEIINCAYEIHNFLGPGLLESVYQKALIHELRLRGFKVDSEVSIDIYYKDVNIGDNLRLDILVNEINRCAAFGCKILVLHPGSSLGQDKIDCLDKIIYGINEAIESTNNDVIIAVETMAGKGNELGSNFDEIGYIVSKISNKNRIGVCLDTCHIHDAGYDLENFDEL